MVKNALKKIYLDFCNKYISNPVEKIDLADFPPDEMKRYQIVFYGIVQGVGFRYETWMIAEKLGLTGFCENRPNGSVYAEIQGPQNKIEYLIKYMKSIKRIQIDDIEQKELPVIEEEGFYPVY